MFEMSVESAICDLRRMLLKDSWRLEDNGYQKGLIVSLDLRMYEDPGSDRSKARSATVHFLFTGDTSVWMATQDRGYKWDEIPWDEWTNTSNHNSCWRTDGVGTPLCQLYFKWAKEINENMAPKDMFLFNGFALGQPLQFVLVKHERDRADKYGYKRKIIDVKLLNEE